MLLLNSYETEKDDILEYGQKCFAKALLDIGVPDQQIVEMLAKQFGISTLDARDILDYVKDVPYPEEW